MGVVTSIVIFFISCISGCTRRSAVFINDVPQTSNIQIFSEKLTVDEHQARLIDIPLPLSVIPLDSFQDICLSGSQDLVGYKAAMPLADLISFYHQEMEQAGWQQEMIIQGKETLLLFEKPNRRAVISLRPTENQNQEIYIIIGISAIKSPFSSPDN